MIPATVLPRLRNLIDKCDAKGSLRYVSRVLAVRWTRQVAAALAGIALMVCLVLPASRAVIGRTRRRWMYSNAIPVFTGSVEKETALLYDKDYEVFRSVFDWLETPTAACEPVLELGGRLDPRTNASRGRVPVCVDPSRTVTAGPGCLVYSLGVGPEMEFERAMAGRGCEVHAFDPVRPAKVARMIPGVTFYLAAVHRLDGTMDGREWRTFDALVDDNGHAERTINFLKVDIDFGEVYMLVQQLLDTDEGRLALDQVQQICLSVHLPKDLEQFSNLLLFDVYDSVLQIFHELGFRVVRSEPNLDDGPLQQYLFPGVERPVYLSYKLLLVRTGRDVWDRLERGTKHLRREFVH
ncbi:uncharacterized protein LOC119099364 [Pollicipes pollicipes]|uniref:uncharacterized protein LOC119099364 n=1 Tax=Pollicipes pollicipes TaxID=41117 RepID=UPI001884A4FB|nr:uncharacterized protein LOC119099364 [Pollicipes pollicipes]